MRRALLTVLSIALAGLPLASIGADESKDPRAGLLKKLPAGSTLNDLQPSPISGLYEFSQGAEVSYLTADGKYLIDGNVYDMDSRENLTETRKSAARVKLLAAVPESQMIVFSPKSPRYTINVFTDVDCGYCRKLHSEIATLNRMGVRVRYLAYPRSGPNTESWRKAEAVWCAADPPGALTRAKAGVPVEVNKLCATSPVAREYRLGQDIGVRGTPTIVTENGDEISGYLPPADLVQQLQELKVARR